MIAPSTNWSREYFVWWNPDWSLSGSCSGGLCTAAQYQSQYVNGWQNPGYMADGSCITLWQYHGNPDFDLTPQTTQGAYFIPGLGDGGAC